MLADTNYIAVGSHDPSLEVQFTAQSVGVSKTGRNRFAPPYHAVAASAEELGAQSQTLQDLTAKFEV